MEALLAVLEGRGDALRYFHATYLRTTRAVATEVARGGFVDAAWTERWDVAFADLYLDAVEEWIRGDTPALPWKVAFQASSDRRVPPLRHVLLGMNAHVNYDLPQSLLAVITDEEFDDPEAVARREKDHRHIDDILVSRVAEEDEELKAVERPGDRTLVDRLLQPFNRAATKRFLKEARRKVWRNARLLSRARREGPAELERRVEELAILSARRVADLNAPGLVLLKLARKGSGWSFPALSSMAPV